MERRMGQHGSPALLWAVSALGVGAGCALIAGVEEGALATASGGAGGTATATGSGEPGGAGGSSTGAGTNTGGSGTGTNTGGGGGSSGPTYAEMVLGDGPVAYWRLGEDTTPTAVDATGNGHDGLYVGGVTIGVPGAIAGDADTAVHFDGDAEVTVGDVFGFEGNAPFSVEVWLMPEIDACSFIGKVWRDTTGTYQGWLVYLQDNELTVRRGYNLGGPMPPEGEFTHVVATYDGYTLRLYENGQLQSDREVSDAVPTHAEPFTFGRTYEWVAFQGVLDEVAVYDTNLPPARILAHYEKGAGLR